MLEKLVIPANTRFEERNIVASGDVIIGPNSKLSYGIIAKKVILGERVMVDGDVLGEEVRLDAWCNVNGDVTSKHDAYIGEFASIGGKLTVYGDLEIGRNVRIKNGFEAKGLITIQDPTPALFFIFLYLMILLRLGRLEEAEKLLEEVEEFDSPLVIPDSTQVSIDRILTSKNAEITASRILGNIKARDIYVSESEIFGSIRGREVIVEKSRVHGAIEGKIVYLLNSSEVFGYIKADKVYMEDGCSVEGGIVGREGVWIRDKVEIPGREEEEEEEEEAEIDEEEEVTTEQELEEAASNNEAEKELEEVEGRKDGVEEEKVSKDVS